jgi:hypothetical protein
MKELAPEDLSFSKKEREETAGHSRKTAQRREML